MTPFITQTQCAICEACFKLDEVTYTCPYCGPAGTLDIVYDYGSLRAATTPGQISAKTAPSELNMWRYRPLLPVIDDDYLPPLPIGWTPLVHAPRLARSSGIRDLWVKDEGRNPTASLKDRASAMVVARANQIGASVVTTASSGNAAAALAGVCASAQKKAVIFVPHKAPQAKITQLLVYGATVFLVQGTYDDAFDLSVQAAQEYGWYCRNSGMNPFTTEGKKTAALEIAEQLGWKAPDVVVVSVGDGSIIAGQYKGFADLHALGWIEKMPRLIGVQAEGSANLVHAWKNKIPPAQMKIGPSETVADSISVGLPRDRVKAMRAVRATDGAFLAVSDAEILAAIPELAQGCGVFAEPAASTALAGLHKAIAEGLIRPDDQVVLLSTGHGLKDIKSAMQSLDVVGERAGKSYPVSPVMDDVRRVVEKLGLIR